MANKLIIDNRTDDLNDLDALDLVMQVVKGGRISNDGKQYCYATIFTVREDSGGCGKKYAVWTVLNEKSDRFVIEPH